MTQNTTTVVCPQSQSLNDWLFYLESQHPTEIELGLDRVKAVAKTAGLTSLNASKVVLVAGTNGKGTTVRFMEKYLLSKGFSVGVFSSPHMHTYHERVRINDSLLPDIQHVNSFQAIEKQRMGTPLTYFEFGTLAAFYLFKEAQLDYVLVEVGLGGRLDATNILSHDLSVITSLGMDHVDWLGNTIEKIGFEKAGIFRPNRPALVGMIDPPVTVNEQALAHHVSELKIAGRDYSVSISSTGDHWSLSSNTLNLTELPRPLIPIQNIATAISALELLEVEIEPKLLSELCSNISLYGRLQIVAEKPLAMVDVGHNPHALNYLIETIKTHPKFSHIKQIEVVIAMMADKDIQLSLRSLLPIVNRWHIAPLVGNTRAASVKEMGEHLSALGAIEVEEYDSISHAWDAQMSRLTKIGDDTLLLGVGSFYTVAEILSCVKDKSKR